MVNGQRLYVKEIFIQNVGISTADADICYEPGPTTTTTNHNNTCYDSDGGEPNQQYYVRGEVDSYYDFCRIGNYGSPYGGDSQDYDEEISSCTGSNCWLVEHFCGEIPGINWDMYNCPYGCSNGACLQEPSALAMV
jgi:hypothetical protein